MSNRVVDQAVRVELLNPQESFIVQAPAGSGKTELLTQRILALLAVVEKPENILAITFTRKAAAEMHSRVVDALTLGVGEAPEAAHELFRWQLAKRVLQRDREKGWYLLENASRLNITTIDSLSAALSSALPLLSQTGALPQIVENAAPYYLQAAENLLQSVSDKDQVAENILTLLNHKDNNLGQVTELLAKMLAKRLQWMATIRSHAQQFDETRLLDSLQQLIEEKLDTLYRLIPQDIISELPELLNQASQVLRKSAKPNKPCLQSLGEVNTITPPGYDDLNLWKAISELFLKASNKAEMLGSFNALSGFPPDKDAANDVEKQRFKQNKQKVTEIAKQLSANEAIVSLLFQIRLLPTNEESFTSQQSLKAAVELLPLAVAHLKVIFSRYNVIDFSELSLTSLEALGHEDMPSDLALALDYKLEHILIDEFQDTSTPQVELIKLLTAGWDESTGRSLFLVGDPMQSIYRFRDANVSLFMQIREQGLGHIRPQFRKLAVNFRSNAVIVDWVNQQFSGIMPATEDMTFSAVSYASSVAFNSANSQASVQSWLTVDAPDNLAQAAKVVEIVEQHLQQNQSLEKKKTLAILARSRTHLSEIIQLLNQRQIDFQAVEIDRLSEKMVVTDLVSLAYALCDQFDELSWAACMRSPWFGLLLNDIRRVLVSGERNLPMPTRIEMALPLMSPESRVRAEKILPVLKAAIAQKGRKPFRKWLYGCYVAVGGLASLDFESDRDDLLVCLDKLSEIQQGGELNDRTLVNDSIAQLFAAPNPKADGQVQLMTIHKSKGLEFDTVILPRLDATGRNSDQVLLKWTEVLDRAGDSHSLLAISRQAGEDNDKVYQFINYLEGEKSRFENQRVLYVAATRAKQHLHLLGNVVSDAKSDGFKLPQANSFLAMLWPGVESCFQRISAVAVKPVILPAAMFSSRQIKQVDLEQVLTLPRISLQPADSLVLEPGAGGEGEERSASLQSASVIGTVLHQQLQWISLHYSNDFQLPSNWRDITRSQLVAQYHFATEELVEEAVSRVIQGVKNTLQDEFGRALLQPHPQAASELVLHKKIESGGFLTRIIDRTFVKEEIRWIIDYKSSQPLKDESREAFIEREKALYFEQLNDYFKMFSKLESRKIIAGLYFPMLAHFERVLES